MAVALLVNFANGVGPRQEVCHGVSKFISSASQIPEHFFAAPEHFFVPPAHCFLNPQEFLRGPGHFSAAPQAFLRGPRHFFAAPAHCFLGPGTLHSRPRNICVAAPAHFLGPTGLFHGAESAAHEPVQFMRLYGIASRDGACRTWTRARTCNSCGEPVIGEQKFGKFGFRAHASISARQTVGHV